MNCKPEIVVSTVLVSSDDQEPSTYDERQTEPTTTEEEPTTIVEELSTTTTASADPSTTSATSTGPTAITAALSGTSSTAKCAKKRKITTQSKVGSFMDKVTEREDEELRLKAAMFFHKCKIPFLIAEDPAYLDFIKALRPAFVHPNRKDISGSLLDKCYDAEVKYNRSLIRDKKHGKLLVDGWKNSAAKTKNAAVMLDVGQRNVLVHSYNISKEGEDAEVLNDVVIDAAAQCKKLYDVDCEVVVTDNAPNMVKMGREINLTHSRCQAHICNLLLKDLGKMMKTDTLMDTILPVLKEFNKAKFAAFFKENKGNAAKLPLEVRWCSNRDSIAN